MVERITISFDMNKEDVLNMFEKGDNMSQALENFLKEYFSFFIGMHAQNIKNNMKAVGQEMEEEQIQKIAFKYLKSCIDEQDMELLKIEAAKAIFKESFANRTETNLATEKAFKAMEVIVIAEKIWKKIRNKYLLSAK